MNNTTHMPTRTESKELTDHWKDKHTELAKKLSQYENETMIMRRKLLKWKFSFWGLIAINVFTIIYLGFIQ